MLAVPQGRFSLRRRHADRTGSLRAWDAADELLLDHVTTIDIDPGRWLVVNDAFGALAVVGAASGRTISSWSDSLVTHLATADNLGRNGMAPSAVEHVPSTTTPDGPVLLALVKVPRTLAHLSDELARLRPLLAPGAVVIGAGMTRHIHRSTIEAFERAIGPTPTTRARKKARLLLSTVDPDLRPPAPPSPIEWTSPDGIAVTALPNVFSSGGLDPGTGLLLDHLPDPPAGASVVDLGCGTGVVGATMAARRPDLDIVACDESYEAVESARRTLARVTTRAAVRVTDVLDGVADRSADLVVVNPPFHAGGARTTAVAERMVVEARRVLRPGGELRLVANRHLDHHVLLRRTFGAVTVVAADPRFSVLSATVTS